MTPRIFALPVIFVGMMLGAFGSPAHADEPGSVVETAEGPVVGIVAADHRLFQGIPYAAPPVGERRWMSPQPVAAWTAPRDATVPGTRCPQTAEPEAGGDPGHEDCLVLNVTVPPSATSDSPKPVMVWLHGAGAGSGAGHDFDARRLAVGGDVVVVTVNYQLGVFGFFGYPGLAGSGGFSLEDQQAALRWVQRNAAAFGGDPGNVTLFGESSGAMNTCAHLTSPSAAGLFQRAIVQSGSCLMTLPANSTFPGVPAASIWATSEEAATLGAVLAGEAGCDEPATAINCLKALSPSELLRTSTAMGFGRAAYGNDVLPRHPAEALQTGQFQRVPVMIGTTRDEATYFIAGFTDPPIDKAYYQELLIDAFGDDAKEIGRVYASTGYDLPALAWAAVITDNAWICPTLDAAHLLAKHVPVYAYEFADANAPLFFPASGFPMGAFHGSELTYLFDILDWDPELTAEQERLANQMIQYWANFARAGDPNGPGLPDWTRFQNTDPESYV